ncbi:MAG: cation-transporting P-type ATPase, partial [archaeon]|nr:cation-transporting P-type ATPase [archaeon]
KAKSKDKFRYIWSIIGLPTEGALKVLGLKYNSKIDEITKSYEFIHEYNFDSSIKRMSKIFRIAGMYQVLSKGATEWILPLCSKYMGVSTIDEDTTNAILTLNKKMRKKIITNMKRFAGAGYRVLTICSRDLTDKEILKDWDSEESRKQIEMDLTFLGLVIIQDPPRDDVKKAVEECKDAGISIVMITGDSVATGKAIAKKIGIFKEEEKHLAIEGKDLKKITDEDFPKTRVYGRVSPEHKQTIIERYQNMGKVVSMTGDGVNDALALSMADCGLAMGIQGTEVAKEAADMVITDDAFSTIVTGIEEGRGLFMKIRIIIYFFICISIMEASILFSSVFLMNQYLFSYWQLNILYITAHMFPSLGFTIMNHSRYIMDEEPRDSAEIIEKDIFFLMIPHMILIGSSIILAFFIGSILPISNINQMWIDLSSATSPGIQNKASTMAYTVMFLLESVLLPLQIRRINQPIKETFEDISFRERLYYSFSMIILVILMYFIPAQNFMTSINCSIDFMYLDIFDWLICISLCLPSLYGFEKVREILHQKEHLDQSEFIKKYPLIHRMGQFWRKFISYFKNKIK